MKTILTTALLCLITFCSLSQVNPTLSVGLENLTMNKGTIDVKVLTDLIMAKQKELKQEALKRFIIGLFPETNYSTRFYVQSCLNILVNEKNPKVIEKQVLELTTNYALALGVAKSYQLRKESLKAKAAYVAYKYNSPEYHAKVLEDYKVYTSQHHDLDADIKKLSKINVKINGLLKLIENVTPKLSEKESAAQYEKYSKELVNKEGERKRLANKISRKKLQKNIDFDPVNITKPDSLPFGILLDVVSLSLSNIDELKNKGFFKIPVDYRYDSFYMGLTGNAESINLKKELDSLYLSVKRDIKPYIKHYDIIKELFSQKVEGVGTINSLLISNYIKQMQSIAPGNNFTEVILRNLTFVDRTASNSLNVTLKKYYDKITAIEIQLQKLNEYVTTFNDLLSINKSSQDLNKMGAELTAKFQKTYSDNPPAITDFAIDGISTDSITKLRASFKRAYDQTVKERSAYSTQFTNLVSKLNQLQTAFNNVGLQANNLANFNPTIEITDLTIQSGKTEEVRTFLNKGIEANAIEIVRTGNFLNLYLNEMINKFATIKSFAVSAGTNQENIKAYTEMLSETYRHLTAIAKLDNITMRDIMYIDDVVIPQFVKFGMIFDRAETDTLPRRIKDFRLLSQLLKVRAVVDVGELNNYSSSLIDLFQFISNLDNLDHAETYQSMVNLFRDINQKVEDNLPEGKFKEVYTLFSNAVNKYTLVNTQEQYVEIDVASFLTTLQQYFEQNNNSRFGLYLTLGLNQNVFFKEITLPNSAEPTKYIGFASEKIGVKYTFSKLRRFHDYENAIKGDVNLNKRAPFVNQWYLIVYGSGLLYSVANTSSTANFDYPHVGIGTGVRFFNALDATFTVGMPFIKTLPLYKGIFYGIGLDIPLGEYLEKLNKK